MNAFTNNEKSEAAILTPFVFENEVVLRTTVIDGDPFFVAADVFKCLGIRNSTGPIGWLMEDEKGVAIADTVEGRRELLIVPEHGLYRLIFTSRAPSAERFKIWVTHEVLPNIRRMPSLEEMEFYLMQADSILNLYGPLPAHKFRITLPIPQLPVEYYPLWLKDALAEEAQAK